MCKYQRILASFYRAFLKFFVKNKDDFPFYPLKIRDFVIFALLSEYLVFLNKKYIQFYILC